MLATTSVLVDPSWDTLEKHCSMLIFFILARRIGFVRDMFASAVPNPLEDKNKYVLLCAIPCLLLTQVRSVKSRLLILFSYTTFILVIVLGSLQVFVVYSSTPPEEKAPVYYFGNPVEGIRGVVEGALASTACTWCFVPTFLTAELAAAMAQPKNLKVSVLLSAILTFLSMFTIGICTVAVWGSDVRNPINISPQWSDATSRAGATAFNWILLLANFGALMLDSVQLGQRMCLWLKPSFDLDDWSFASSAVYLGATLIPTAGGVLISRIVPDVFSMLAYSTALTVSASNHAYPAICFLSRFPSRSAEVKSEALLYDDVHAPPEYMGRKTAFAVLIFGIANTAVLMFAAVGQSVYGGD